ncbi:hypothetical protein BCV70DRAFT_196935 [Testicularia cyperi]|uniref:Uncharacterized protein n=1 Tax=Testicularia cyperi TaxID=1882483 RepID=A0A317XZB4_9BASI|nr:hypothetical protein BCV70DRAFT_196935 [Testicularia cyperi]
MSFASGHAAASAYPQSPDPTLSDPKWLEQLADHPIFAGQTPIDGATASPVSSSIHPRFMTTRGTDIVVVVNNEIRMASLVDAKASVSTTPLSPSPSSSALPPNPALSYKTLVSSSEPSHLGFEVQHLSVNPTGKLLACVGEDQIAIVVLPRSGYTKHVERTITCRTAAIGAYYHSAHAATGIVKVTWHPWGDAGTSLLVLTDDAVLREYDIAKDTEEPQQTLSFVPTTSAAPPTSAASQRARSRSATPTAASLMAGSSPMPTRIRGGFGSPAPARLSSPSSYAGGLTAEDDDATTAVSFSLCISQAPSSAPATIFDAAGNDQDQNEWASAARRARAPADWSPLTVFCLMKNGDIWAVCPFMPRNAVVPASYVHSLAKLTSLKAASVDTDYDDARSQSDLQLRYLNSLLQQTSSSSAAGRSDGGRSSVTPGPEAFRRARSTSTMDLDQFVEGTPSPEDGLPAQTDAEQDLVHDLPVRLHPPSWSFSSDLRSGNSAKKAPRPQGPFLLKPAPIELCDERESSACDIVWTWLTKDLAGSAGVSASGEGVDGVGALAVVGHDGRVDVGLLLESVEASWGKGIRSSSGGRASRRRSAKPAKTNRYGLSDTEDEADELEAMTLDDRPALPSLLMYETIDLGLLDAAQAAGLPSQAAASDFLLQAAESNAPCFVRDPLYEDTLYVYHSLGAQCLGMAKWAGKLIDTLNLPSEDELDPAGQTNKHSREKALTRLLHAGDSTEVVWVIKTATESSTDGHTSKSPAVNPVTSISILSDVYLSYAFLAVTRDLQLVAVELSLRVEMDAQSSDDALGDAGATRLITEGPKPYVSLLGDGGAFQPPAIFSGGAGLQGLSSHPRRAAAGAGRSSQQLQITPETLRELGKAVEGYRLEIRDVVSAGNAVQARLDLQIREMTRQLEKLDSIRKRSDELLGVESSSSNVGAQERAQKETLEKRIERIAKTQASLIARTDRALQRLMDSHQPSLSIYEQKWFEELRRIGDEVGVVEAPNGALVLDSKNRKSLSNRASALAHQLELLRPQLERAKQNQQQRRGADGGAAAEKKGETLGTSQRNKVEAMLSHQSSMLAEAKQRISHLTQQLAHSRAPLSQPASASLTSTSTSALPTSSTLYSFADLSSSSATRSPGFLRNRSTPLRGSGGF